MRHAKALVSLALTLLLLGQASIVASAQDAMPPGVTLDVIANGMVASLPDDADQMLLMRFVIEPGATIPVEPDSSRVALFETEHGEITVTVDGEASISRATAEPGVTETMAADTPFTLQPGDAATFPAGLKGELQNAGEDSVTLLVLFTAPDMSDDDNMMTPPEGLTVDFLAVGQVPDVGDDGALLWIGRFTLDPGATFPGQSQPGAEVGSGELGVFTMTPTSGTGLTIWRKFPIAMMSGMEPNVEEIAVGQSTTFGAGDATYFGDGSVDLGNDGDVSATVIFGGIGPAPSEEQG